MTSNFTVTTSDTNNSCTFVKFFDLLKSWRFVPKKKIPLLAQLATKYATILSFVLSIVGHPFQQLNYFDIFHRQPMVRFCPENNESTPQQFAEFISSNFSGNRSIYTDGSKQKEARGRPSSTLTLKFITKSAQVCPGSSSFDCEVAAISWPLTTSRKYHMTPMPIIIF